MEFMLYFERVGVDNDGMMGTLDKIIGRILHYRGNQSIPGGVKKHNPPTQLRNEGSIERRISHLIASA